MKSLPLILPYAVWMVLLTALPQTAWAYAVRGAATAAALAVTWNRLGLGRLTCAGLGAGFPVGLAVFGIWIAPDLLGWTTLAVSDATSPYDPAVCGGMLTCAKLAASAFVIPIAEEVFFRKWLLAFGGFWWSLVLFASVHGERWHVAAVTGVAYWLLARRFGLWSAIVAHMTTNLVLGLYVIFGGRWFYW